MGYWPYLEEFASGEVSEEPVILSIGQVQQLCSEMDTGWPLLY